MDPIADQVRALHVRRAMRKYAPLLIALSLIGIGGVGGLPLAIAESGTGAGSGTTDQSGSATSGGMIVSPSQPGSISQDQRDTTSSSQTSQATGIGTTDGSMGDTTGEIVGSAPVPTSTPLSQPLATPTPFSGAAGTAAQECTPGSMDASGNLCGTGVPGGSTGVGSGTVGPPLGMPGGSSR